MAAGKVNITYYLDRDLSEEIKVFEVDRSSQEVTRTPFNYTGCTAKMQVRRKTQDKDAKVFLELSTSDYSIILESGQIELTKSKNEITALTEPGKYVYDILLTFATGTVIQHLEGDFIVKSTVTDD